MQNIKKLLAMLLMMASVFFFSCSDDEPEKKLSKEETKTEITQLNIDLSGKLAEMSESEGMIAMESLMKLEYPFETSVKSNKRSVVLNNVQKYLLPYNYAKKGLEKSTFEPASFDFDTYVGTYTYHNTPFPYWEVVTGGTKIIINFPSDTTNLDVNDAVLTMYNYDEVLIDYDYLPTDIDVDLYLSNIKVVDIDFTAAWNTSGEPTALHASVYLIPFEFIGTYNNTNLAANIDFAIKYNTEQIFSAGVGATWASAGDSIPSNINGYLQLFHIKLQADADLANIIVIISDYQAGTSNYTTVEEAIDAVNNEIDAYVTVSGTWAADIELALIPIINEEGEDDYDLDILFVYADGSSESAIPYFEEIGLEIEDFFGDLEDYYGNW